MREMFTSHAISARWCGMAAHLPGLSPCDYFIWDMLILKCRKHRPATIEELKAAILQTVEEEITRRVMETSEIVSSNVSHVESAT